MRTALLIAATLATAAIPFGSAQADAGVFALGKKKGPKGLKGKKKGKGKGKSKGKHDSNKGKHKGKNKGKKSGKGHGPGDGDTCELPNSVQSMMKGAGQRLSFTFAGKVWTRDGKTSGNFFLAYHPQSPGSAVVHVSCRYNEFSNVSMSASQTRFRMQGTCRQVFDDGRIESVGATNDVVINNGSTDSVSISAVGGGLSVPPGALSFGNFQMASRDDSSTAT